MNKIINCNIPNKNNFSSFELKKLYNKSNFINDYYSQICVTKISKILKTNKVKAFMGHNRSRSAIIEACILASRIKILEEKKIFDELNYLSIAISKTSGKKELILWKELNKFIRKELKLKKKYD